jgi:hypothetical protein
MGGQEGVKCYDMVLDRGDRCLFEFADFFLVLAASLFALGTVGAQIN